MPTKKKKVAPKKADQKTVKSVKSAVKATKATKKVVATSKFEMDYGAKVACAILYIWDAFIIFSAVANVVSIFSNKVISTESTSLLTYFITAIQIIMAFVIFKVARAVADGSDDGYTGAVVVLMHMGIFGLNGLNLGTGFNGLSWVILAVAIMGLIFVFPGLGKYRKVESHVLSTWAIVLLILYWFAATVISQLTLA